MGSVLENESIKLSVIIPVYNIAPYLERCLSSVLGQSYHNLEVICVNDGSTDNSEEVLQKIAQEDHRVIVLSQKNAGVSAARNKGIDHATGDYLTFVDGDDAIDKEMYSTLLDLSIRSNAEIAHCGYRRIEPDGTIKDVMGTGQCIMQNTVEAMSCLINGTLFVGSLCNKVYNASLFDKVRLADNLRYNEDILANAQMFFKAKKSIYIDKPLYLYYIRENSATKAENPQWKAEDSTYVSQRIFEMVKDSDLEGIAATRLFSSLSSLYRAYLSSERINEQLKKTKKMMKELMPKCKGLSYKQLLNYHLMTKTPALYKQIYKVYDRLRVPNWDIK